MNIHAKLFCAAALAGFAFAAASPAQALTSQECSAKYQAAKKDGTLGGQKWNDFRKAQCGADATPVTFTDGYTIAFSSDSCVTRSNFLIQSVRRNLAYYEKFERPLIRKLAANAFK